MKALSCSCSIKFELDLISDTTIKGSFFCCCCLFFSTIASNKKKCFLHEAFFCLTFSRFCFNPTKVFLARNVVLIYVHKAQVHSYKPALNSLMSDE